MVAVANFTSHKWIGDIDVPVSVLVTNRDSVVPQARQMKLVHTVPHATVITVDGDHDVFVASPRLFAQKMLEACQAVTVTHRDRRGAYSQPSSRRASRG